MSGRLAANLRALARRDPRLALSIEQAEPATGLSLLSARTGDPVPALLVAGRPVALHSLVDPSREAQRLHDALASQGTGDDAEQACDSTGYLLFAGLGGGYQLRPFLRSPGLRHALVVEQDTGKLKALLTLIDLSAELSDPRVHLFVDPSSEELSAHIRTTYLPAVMGRFLSVPLRSRTRLSPSFFESVAEAARAALTETARDYSVQATFGRLWTRNIVANLLALPPGPAALRPQVEEAIITAAGPSLDAQAEELAAMRPGRYLIATDSSLPALRERDLIPDAVLTIDCQSASHYHYLGGIPPTTQLFYELAAPPSVVRLASRSHPAAGGHPLSQLAASRMDGILRIDTSGGNVTHAAVSLAFALGARRIHLFGADFSYPFGMVYARGTYLHGYFAAAQRRTTPLEGGLAEIMLRDSTLQRESVPGGFRYTTERLLAYRQRLEELIAPFPLRLRQAAGSGLPLRLPSAADSVDLSRLDPRLRDRSAPGLRARGNHEAPSAREPAARKFLAEYRSAVAGLSPDYAAERFDPSAADDPLSPPAVFATLYPVMARLRAERGRAEAPALLAEAQRNVLAIIERGMS